MRQEVRLCEHTRRPAPQGSHVDFWSLEENHLADGVAPGLFVFAPHSLQRSLDAEGYAIGRRNSAIGADRILVKRVEDRRFGCSISVVLPGASQQLCLHFGCTVGAAGADEPGFCRLKKTFSFEGVSRCDSVAPSPLQYLENAFGVARSQALVGQRL